MPRVSVAFENAQGAVSAYVLELESGNCGLDVLLAADPDFDAQDFMIEKNGFPVTADELIGHDDCQISVYRKPFAKADGYCASPWHEVTYGDESIRGFEDWNLGEALLNNPDVSVPVMVGTGNELVAILSSDMETERVLSDSQRSLVRFGDISEIFIRPIPVTEQPTSAAPVQGNTVSSESINVWYTASDVGYARQESIAAGTTVSTYLRNKGIDAASSIVRVNSLSVVSDYRLQHADRISVTPSKIKGASESINVWYTASDVGYARQESISAGTTVATYLRNKGIDAASSIVRVNSLSVVPDYQLRHADRISVTPSKIKGA